MSSVLAVSPEVQADRIARVLRLGKNVARDCDAAQSALLKDLREIAPFEYLHILAFDKKSEAPAWQILQSPSENSQHCGRKDSLQDMPSAWALEIREQLVVSDWRDETRFMEFREFLCGQGVVSTCTLPLVRGARRLGVVTFGSVLSGSYPEDEVSFLTLVADQLALVFDAAVNLYSSELLQDRMQLILDLTNQVVSNLEFNELLHVISASVRQVMGCDAAAVMLPDEEGKHLRVHALDFPTSKGVFTEGGLLDIEGTLPGDAFTSGKTIVINRLDPEVIGWEMYGKAKAEGMNSFCDLPLMSRKRLLGVLAVARHEEDTFQEDEVNFLTQVANQVAIAIENATAYRKIAILKDKLAQEKLYLEEEIRGEMDFEGIVGQSSALRHVLSLVETVAPSDSTVLLLGETGTGKELIARAIHDRSRRKDRTLVKINCAAIPTGLLESELFGHEKGAFTGAISQKIGRLELADQSTLFLDEVGDIPIEIQPKLLRALQEREFERLGSTHTRKVNVRLIAATNRDLEKMVASREFRSDLYYRLHVFPIRIPPLRERKEDIPQLVSYFVQKFAKQMQKKIEAISPAVMKGLTAWDWPGNIRELENFIERAVIVTRGKSLEAPVGELRKTNTVAFPHDEQRNVEQVAGERTDSESGPTSVADEYERRQRDEIIRALTACKGRVGGADGAAARLGMNRTTFLSRMKKFGIYAKQYA